jgi:hypothetical protein
VAAPKEISSLVERFERQIAVYKSAHYNETQLRREFLDPFFKALGWDIENEQGYAEPYKDVVHEDAIKVGEATKAPDYSFRIGGARKFFLEAKKPSVDIKHDVSPAFQLRRYAWTSKLPLSVLSDFEEFAVYDCRVKPDQRDNAATARILYIPYTEYVARWEEIAGVFSREAVLKGSFDQFAESTKSKRGTADVDAEFLKTIEGWREELARNFALRNPQLSQRELNFAVQRTIDRVIFLRICEGRGIEDYGRLQALSNGDRIYPRLAQLFEQADDRYNSGLFHFKPEPGRHEAPDELTLSLELDDKLLREILKSLYYPESPYVFSALSADILGQVYEQFLGKIIRLTEGHRAVVEEKPEVKKAGGVYYTPTHIVEYIVQTTVGVLLKDQPPRQAAELKVVDPACGSGSFLLGAYEYLLQWHLDFYTKNDPAKRAKGARPAIVQTTAGWKLTIDERKRILLDNIYGVDIDPQAVETTKLSLLLKVLEGETQQSLQPVLRMFQGRALPDLADNIKCGNSLVGPDFYEQQQMALFDDEARYRINVFDWHAEFPSVFARGGFDAVIGNPPYVRQETLSEYKGYFQQRYEAFDSGADLYAYFMEKGVKLLREGGRFSVIVSSSFLRAAYGERLREMLKKNGAVIRILDFGGLAVFENAKDTYVCIPLLAKGLRQKRVEISRVVSPETRKLAGHVAANHWTIPAERLSPAAWSLKSDAEAAVFAKLASLGKPLGDYVERRLFYGVKTGLNEAFEITTVQRTALLKPPGAAKTLVKSFVGGQDLRRYDLNHEGRFLIVIPCGWTREQAAKERKDSSGLSEREAWIWFKQKYPRLADHFAPFAETLKKRQDQGDYWWELRPCDYYHCFDRPKIVFPDICKGPRFCLDRSGLYLANTAYCLGTDDLYLLGVLNSRLFWFDISHLSIPFGLRAGQYRYRLIYQYMEKIPIRVIDFSNKSDKSRHDLLVKLVGQMLELHPRLAAARTPVEKTALERQIAAADSQIDRLIYDLYGLTEDEIKIVEAA